MRTTSAARGDPDDLGQDHFDPLLLHRFGLDPGLGTTGWGLIQAEGNRLSHLANGQLKTNAAEPLPRRLAAYISNEAITL